MPSQKSAAAPGGLKAVTTASFRQDVIAESARQPVLVDFWAPWCGPCKQLTPILERAVAAAGGKVKLVALNIDEHPQIPGQLGIQSIPAVIAFQKGQPIDGFVGALPEKEIKGFIERLVGPLAGGLDDMAAEAGALAAAGQGEAAREIYEAALAEEPGHAKATAGLARLLLESGDADGARALLDAAPPEAAKDAAFAAARASLDLADQAETLGDVAGLEARIAADPNDHQARLDLAVALNARGRRDEAADRLLEILKRDRKWNDEAARRQLLQFFDAWGLMDAATLAARRKLSGLLYS